MGGGEGIEVDWGDVLEELALVENADKVSTDESTETVSSDGEFRHDTPALFEFLYFPEDLMRLSDRVARIGSENRPPQRLALRHDQRHHTCNPPYSFSRRGFGIRQGRRPSHPTTSFLSFGPSH